MFLKAADRFVNLHGMQLTRCDSGEVVTIHWALVEGEVAGNKGHYIKLREPILIRDAVNAASDNIVDSLDSSEILSKHDRIRSAFPPLSLTP